MTLIRNDLCIEVMHDSSKSSDEMSLMLLFWDFSRNRKTSEIYTIDLHVSNSVEKVHKFYVFSQFLKIQIRLELLIMFSYPHFCAISNSKTASWALKHKRLPIEIKWRIEAYTIQLSHVTKTLKGFMRSGAEIVMKICEPP